MGRIFPHSLNWFPVFLIATLARTPFPPESVELVGFKACYSGVSLEFRPPLPASFLVGFPVSFVFLFLGLDPHFGGVHSLLAFREMVHGRQIF